MRNKKRDRKTDGVGGSAVKVKRPRKDKKENDDEGTLHHSGSMSKARSKRVIVDEDEDDEEEDEESGGGDDESEEEEEEDEEEEEEEEVDEISLYRRLDMHDAELRDKSPLQMRKVKPAHMHQIQSIS
jgi:hypothetical protein